MSANLNFHLIDWIILFLYLGITVFVGLRAKRYVENMEGYFVAGRKVRVALGSATLIATEIGIVTFMYFAELGYVTGFSCFILGIIGLVCYVIIGRTGFIVSALRKLKVITIPEFYELRFGKNVRLLGGIILFLGGVLNMGIFLKFDGIFLTETIGLGQNVIAIVMIIMLIIVVSYTILGGMFSVVITDFMQFVVLSLGMFVATIAILSKISLSQIASVVSQRLGEAGVNPLVNERFGLIFILWMLIGTFATSALWQPVTSKSLASENPEVGRKVFLITGLALAGRCMIPMFWGVAALALLPGIDPKAAMPRLLGLVVPIGFLGLMIAGMLAASMSTYSAYLLAWSSVATRDIIGPLHKKSLPEKRTILLTRMIATLIGIFLLVFGLFYEIPATAFQYLAVTAAMYSAGAFGCVVGGIYWKKANRVGAYCALLMGALAPIAFLVLEKFKHLLPSGMLFLVDVNISGFLAFILAPLGMIIGSLATQKTHPPVLISELEAAP
jgi:SSS family solute:Na+ symporter